MNKVHETTVALLAVFFLINCHTGKSTEPGEVSLKHAQELRNKYQPVPEIFEVEPTKKTSIKTNEGSVIRIPANAFQGHKKLKIKWVETNTSKEAFALGVPMHDKDGRLFQSDGMFKLDTDAKMKGKSAIQVSMVTSSKRPMNVYAWVNGKWEFRGKNQLKPGNTAKSEKNIRSFTGVEPNVLYNFDVPTDPEEQSCVTVIVPTKQKNLVLIATETDGRSFVEVGAENSDRISMRFLAGVSVHLELLGPGRQFWEQADYPMPPRREKGAVSEICGTITATFRKLPPQVSAVPTTPEEYEAKLKETKKKFGRLSRVTMKNGERYVGYFSHEGSKMRIETPNGTVNVLVRDVQKVTPMH